MTEREKELEAALRECAKALEKWIALYFEYSGIKQHDGDMEPVRRARAALSARKGEGND